MRNGQSTVSGVLAAIDALQAVGIRPHLSITVTAQNSAKLHAIVRHAIEHDLSFSFNLCRANSAAAAHAELQQPAEELIADLRRAFAVLGELLPRRSVLGTVLDRGHLLAPHTQACGVGQNYIVIDQRGFVSKCHMLMEEAVAHVAEGNLLPAIQHSSAAPHNPPVTAKPECQACQWRLFCTGGCPLSAYRATGRYDAPSPYCSVYQAIYPLAVRLEGLRLLKYGAG